MSTCLPFRIQRSLFRRLKDLIKKYGGRVPKREKSSSEGEGSSFKQPLVMALIDAMRFNEEFANDYRLIAQTIMRESDSGKVKRGFGGTPQTEGDSKQK